MKFADNMTAAQELLEEQVCQLEHIFKVGIPRVVAKDRSDPFHCLSDGDLERYRLPKDAITDLPEQVRPHAHMDRMGRYSTVDPN